jgi:mitochondrial fission protein ELM1
LNPPLGFGVVWRYSPDMTSPLSESSTPTLPQGTTAWVLASGKVGHEVHCIGIARELGLEPVLKQVRPRALFAALSPFGPIDPRDSAHRPGSLLAAPPFPDRVFAAGRVTVPYLRHLRRASGGRSFTIFLQDPRTGAGTADLLWAPEHDKLRGENVVVTLTSPHPLRPHVLAAARATPDPRLASLPHPRVAMVLGGPSAHHRFEDMDVAALVGIATDLAASGCGVMVTPSRRTPERLTTALAEALAGKAAFVWDGAGDNPYAAMIALADAIVVTGDSVNMVGEALAAGVPVQVYEPSGGHPKIAGFVEKLAQAGHVRRWAGQLERWDNPPLDATSRIAGEIARRYGAFRAASPNR